MVLLEKLYISYFMIESFEVTLREENVDKQIERLAKVLLSDIVMDNEETTISMDGVLSVFAGIGGLGWKLYEERQLDYPPAEKARNVAFYARTACRQAFPNLDNKECDKIAAALVAFLAWLVDHASQGERHGAGHATLWPGFSHQPKILCRASALYAS